MFWLFNFFVKFNTLEHAFTFSRLNVSWFSKKLGNDSNEAKTSLRMNMESAAKHAELISGWYAMQIFVRVPLYCFESLNRKWVVRVPRHPQRCRTW